MNRKISFEQYRAIDLTILSVVLVICQFLTHLAASFWFPEQLYVVSPVAGMTALVMMRWGGYGALPAALGGVVFTALSGGNARHFLIYGGGKEGYLCLEPQTCLANCQNAPFPRNKSGFDYIQPKKSKSYWSKIYLEEIK